MNRTRIGREAEAAVADYLRARGYSIVARNLRLGALELDLVARRGGVVAVVEVRARGPSSWLSGFGSLRGDKRWRIRVAGQRLWQRRYQHDPSVERLRFDAASVTMGPHGTRVEYVEAAF